MMRKNILLSKRAAQRHLNHLHDRFPLPSSVLMPKRISSCSILKTYQNKAFLVAIFYFIQRRRRAIWRGIFALHRVLPSNHCCSGRDTELICENNALVQRRIERAPPLEAERDRRMIRRSFLGALRYL